MIKYSKFTDDIGSENFGGTFCQKTDKILKNLYVRGGWGWGCYAPPSARHALGCIVFRKQLFTGAEIYTGARTYSWLVGGNILKR